MIKDMCRTKQIPVNPFRKFAYEVPEPFYTSETIKPEDGNYSL